MKTLKTTLIVTGIIVVVGIAGVTISIRACSSAVSDFTSVTGSEGTVTLAEFKKIQTGMTYAEVVKIIGGEGTEMSRVDISGVASTVMYGWDGAGSFGANMNATFQGGQLTTKAQFGLR